MVVYICSKFHANILDGIRVIERTRHSSEKFQRAIIPKKNVGRVSYLFSAHRLVMVYICTKFHENILNDIS